MLGRHSWLVPEPFRHYVDRELVSQFRLPAGSEILKQARPRRHPGFRKDSLELGPEVGVGVAIAADDEFGALGCQFARILQRLL